MVIENSGESFGKMLFKISEEVRQKDKLALIEMIREKLRQEALKGANRFSMVVDGEYQTSVMAWAMSQEINIKQDNNYVIFEW